MKRHNLHTVWCNISGEAAGEIWHWSLLGVKGFKAWDFKSNAYTSSVLESSLDAKTTHR